MAEMTGLPMLAQYPQWARGPARIVEGDVVLDEARAEPYFIYDNDDGLMFRLAGLARALDNLDLEFVLAFVRRYGLLWHGADQLGTGECRESVGDLRTEAGVFADLLDLYIGLRKSVLVGSIAPLQGLEIDFPSYFQRTLDDETVMAQASIFLGEQITEALSDCTHSVVSSAIGDEEFSNPDRFLLSIKPPNLLSMAYVRFAYAIVEKASINECPGCGQTFIPGSGRQKYCTPSCASTSRWRKWKGRKSSE